MCALSLVMRRGGPCGPPLAGTGHTGRTPSWIAAILVPSGDQAGPPPPRESIDISGSGANHLSSFSFVDDIVRIWFVPTRKRFVISARPATASRWPSGDHTGAPGCGSESWTFVTLPVAT